MIFYFVFSKNLREDLFEQNFQWKEKYQFLHDFFHLVLKKADGFFNQFWFKSSSGNLFNATEFSCKRFLV